MSNYSVLKQDINNNIYENQTQQITGTVLNAILNEMTASLGAGYQFAGVATLGMNPGDPDQRVFYLAGEGIYTNFGGIQVPAGKLGVLKWDNRWTLQTIDGLGGGGANLTGYVSVASTDDLPEEGQPTLGYLCGTNLYLYVGEGGDTKDGKYQNCGGFRGPEGVGVTEIEQVEQSTANGGRNTIRIHLSNGSSYDVYTRNGTTSTGLFPTLAALQAAYPSPVVGQYAFVGAGFPADIYVCNTAGTWTDSGADYDGDSVDLTDYATKAELNQLEAKVDGGDQKLGPIVGTFEIGNINYLTGADAVNPKGARTNYIPVFNDAQFIIRFPTSIDVNWYVVKYLDGVYAGYEFIVGDGTGNIIKNIAKDATFNSVRFRFSRPTNWTNEEIELCSCIGYSVGSISEKVSSQNKSIEQIIGEDTAIERGGINYLNGNRINDTKSVRTDFISLANEKTSIIVDLSEVAENFNYYVVKYNNFGYIGYSNGLARGGKENEIIVEKDNTFNQVAVRLSRDVDLTDAQVNAISLRVVSTLYYTNYKYEILNKRDYIYPELHEGFYVHKDDGKLRKFAGWYYSDFIEVIPGEYVFYSFWGAQSASLCAYDAEMNFVQALVYGVGENTGESLIQNPRIKYVRGCTNNNSYYVVKVLKPYVYAKGYTLGCNSVYLQGEEKRAEGFLNIESRQVETPWIKLKENNTFPSDGVYFGKMGDDVVLSIYGVIKKLN